MKKVPFTSRWLWLPLAGLLTACALPERVPAPLRYDFGPPMVATAATQPGTRALLALRVQASPALDSPSMLYRLAYADAQQLRAYSQARWALLPAELVQQRLRASVVERTAGGELLVAQRDWQLQHPAPTADAAGGVRALHAATETMVTELVQWLQMQR